MNLYHCGEPNCMHTAVVHGDAIGLRAVGWFVSGVNPFGLCCPLHHPNQEEKIASTAVIQYVLEHHYDTFVAKDAERRLMAPPPRDPQPAPFPPPPQIGAPYIPQAVTVPAAPIQITNPWVNTPITKL